MTPLETAVRRAVETVALRKPGCHPGRDGFGGRRSPAAVREEIVRIAREAVSNACRHGRAKLIDVQLTRAADQYHLRVHDDGNRLRSQATEVSPSRFGMRSMRERAEAISGRLQVELFAWRRYDGLNSHGRTR